MEQMEQMEQTEQMVQQELGATGTKGATGSVGAQGSTGAQGATDSQGYQVKLVQMVIKDIRVLLGLREQLVRVPLVHKVLKVLKE